jgi:hypothetical protein
MVPLEDDENDPYTRWQGIRITHLGFCIALFLTFSVATLGFAANLLVQPTYEISGCLAKLLFSSSGVCGVFSIICGALTCLTRLADFRITARVARHRTDTGRAREVDSWRERYRVLGKRTWALFKSQLVLFALQEISLIACLVITYWCRLW